MPIKRKLAKEFNTWNRIIFMARDSVRIIQQPLTDQGWKNLISKELEIDIETSTRIFEELVEKGVLIFTRTRANRAIYINDRTPEFKRYMWSGDLEYV
jgi:hypothetical protein